MKIIITLFCSSENNHYLCNEKIVNTCANIAIILETYK